MDRLPHILRHHEEDGGQQPDESYSASASKRRKGDDFERDDSFEKRSVSSNSMMLPQFPTQASTTPYFLTSSGMGNPAHRDTNIGQPIGAGTNGLGNGWSASSSTNSANPDYVLHSAHHALPSPNSSSSSSSSPYLQQPLMHPSAFLPAQSVFTPLLHDVSALAMRPSYVPDNAAQPSSFIIPHMNSGSATNNNNSTSNGAVPLTHSLQMSNPLLNPYLPSFVPQQRLEHEQYGAATPYALLPQGPLGAQNAFLAQQHAQAQAAAVAAHQQQQSLLSQEQQGEDKRRLQPRYAGKPEDMKIFSEREGEKNVALDFFIFFFSSCALFFPPKQSTSTNECTHAKSFCWPAAQCHAGGTKQRALCAFGAAKCSTAKIVQKRKQVQTVTSQEENHNNTHSKHFRFWICSFQFLYLSSL